MVEDDAAKALAAFEKAYDDYEKAYTASLVTEGTKAFIQGDLKAQKALNLKLKFNLVNQEALKYIKAYKKELAAGGSTIQGEFVPWLEDKSKEERAAISKILEDGYKAGKPTGVREYKRGGYPKNSIAADLQEYFNSRRSHAALVARTEIARIQSHGSMTRYHKQGIKKVMWLVFNPCPICAQYARRVYDIDKLPREIPVHPRCRCSAAPVPDDVPTGPAPDQPVPEVFERGAKALPVQPAPVWKPEKWQGGIARVPDKAPSVSWKRYEERDYSTAQIKAADYYTGSGYDDINRWLRDPDFDNFNYAGSGGLGYYDELVDLMKKHEKNLDEVIDGARIPEDVMLYRSPGRRFAKELMEKGEATEPGYSSTATKFSSANNFGRRGEDGYKNILVVQGRTEQPAFYVSVGENEVILPRNTKYKLIGIQEVDEVKTSDLYHGFDKCRFLFVKII